MKVSSRLDYALSFVLRVADKYETKRPVSVAYISQKEKVAPDYIEQLLLHMRRAGIVKSIRGSAGGYILARPPDKISTKKVVEAIEKNVLEPVCFRKKGRRRQCVHISDCRLKDFWLELGKVMTLFLERRSLKELLLLRRKERNW